MNFEKAIPITLEHEGGYVNHPSDPGGETNFGITKRSYPELDIKNLTLTMAISIYKRDYWDKNGIERYPDNIRLEMFDMSVNMGNKNAVKTLQIAINRFGKSIAVDGITGPQTLGAIRSLANKEWLLRAMIHGERIQYYYRLVERRPASEVFLVGWIKRASMILLES